MNTITKKLSGALTALLVATTIFGFVALPTAQALTESQIDSILDLLSNFGADQSTLNDVESALNGEPTTGNGSSVTASCDTFGTAAIVRVGHTGANVVAVQKAMNHVTELSGSSMAPLVLDGNFGPLTKLSVQQFQGIIGTLQDGINGPNTYASYLAYAADNCEEEVVVTPPTGEGDGMVSLSNSTPAGATIADAGNANVTKFTIEAGEDDLSINYIWVTKGGQSESSVWENIKVLDGDGVALTSAGSVNSNNKTKMTFTPNVEIESGESMDFFIRAGVVSATVSGKLGYFGINSVDDISFDGSPEVGGDFPVMGETFESVNLAIGSVTVTNDGSVSDSTPDTGDENVITNKFKVSAGSTEAVTIEQIQVEKSGSASSDDTVNIELYSVTDGESLGSVSSWDAQGLATFSDLGLFIDEGENHRFRVMVDIVDGAGLTVDTDFTDGSDVRMQVVGSDYGYYITPSVTGGWDGTGSSVQTIASGALTVAKSSATPSTGNITSGDERLVGVFDLIAEGEAMQVTSFRVSFQLATMLDTEISNARIKNYETGETIGGPNDISATDYTINSETYDATATFTDTFEVEVGTTQIAVYVDISDDVTATTDTIYAGIGDGADDLTTKGLTSNDSITESPATSVVNTNTLTVQAGTLAAVTLTTPAARNVVVGSSDFVWAEIDLSAANSGEDVEVTDLVIEATMADATNSADDLNNFEIWADLTSGDSSRGDRYETQVSQTKQFSDSGAADETLSFALTQALDIEMDDSVRIAIVGDLASGASTSAVTYALSLDTDAGDITVNGADTGASLSITPSGAGQTMTADAGGALTVTVDSSSPTSPGVLLDDMQDGRVHLGTFRLAADADEDLDLDSFKLTDDGTTANTAEPVTSYYFQAKNSGGANLGSEKEAPGAGTAEVFWADGEVTVPADSHIFMYVYGDVANITSNTGTGLNQGDSVEVTVAATGDVDSTGLSSGAEVDSGAAGGDAATFTIWESYPTFAWQTVSNTTITNNASHLVAKLEITANGEYDVTFQKTDGNVIDFQTSMIQSDDDAAVADPIFTIKDENGVTHDNSLAATSGTTELTIDFDLADDTDVNLTVPAGGTKVLYFYINTADLETDNDSVQVYLDDSAAADLDFGIDGENFANAEADVLWRSDYMSDQYSQLHINPS
jgi:hypothetical protein